MMINDIVELLNGWIISASRESHKLNELEPVTPERICLNKIIHARNLIEKALREYKLEIGE